jgi:hypothetical protein
MSCGNESIDVFIAREITRDSERNAATVFDLPLYFFELGKGARRKNDTAAGICESERDGFAYTSARAGD